MELWLILTFFSAIVVSLKDIISKKILIEYKVSANQVLLEENLIIFIIVLIIFFPFIQINLFIDNFSLFLAKACSLGSFSILYLILLKKYELSLVAPILNLSPFFLLILSTLFLNEIISFLQVIGILIIIISTFFLERFQKKEINSITKKSTLSTKIKFYIISFFMLLAVSLEAIFNKIIFDNGINVYSNLFFSSLIIFIAIIIYLIKERKLSSNIKNLISKPKISIIGFVSILDNFIILSAISFPTAIVSLIIPIRRTSTLFSALFGGLLFHESHIFKKIIIISAMILGVFFIVI